MDREKTYASRATSRRSRDHPINACVIRLVVRSNSARSFCVGHRSVSRNHHPITHLGNQRRLVGPTVHIDKEPGNAGRGGLRSQLARHFPLHLPGTDVPANMVGQQSTRKTEGTVFSRNSTRSMLARKHPTPRFLGFFRHFRALLPADSTTGPARPPLG